LIVGITVRPLPAGLNGWWNKLYLFAPGLFPKGDRIFISISIPSSRGGWTK
jgi:hypothetical protein